MMFSFLIIYCLFVNPHVQLQHDTFYANLLGSFHLACFIYTSGGEYVWWNQSVRFQVPSICKTETTMMCTNHVQMMLKFRTQKKMDLDHSYPVEYTTFTFWTFVRKLLNWFSRLKYQIKFYWIPLPLHYDTWLCL